MRLSSIDAVWFGMVFSSFISSFSTFPGGWVVEIKNTAKLSLAKGIFPLFKEKSVCERKTPGVPETKWKCEQEKPDGAHGQICGKHARK